MVGVIFARIHLIDGVLPLFAVIAPRDVQVNRRERHLEFVLSRRGCGFLRGRLRFRLCPGVCLFIAGFDDRQFCVCRYLLPGGVRLNCRRTFILRHIFHAKNPRRLQRQGQYKRKQDQQNSGFFALFHLIPPLSERCFFHTAMFRRAVRLFLTEDQLETHKKGR